MMWAFMIILAVGEIWIAQSLETISTKITMLQVLQYNIRRKDGER